MQTKKLYYTDTGYSYIKCARNDCFNWGGLGICDNCGNLMEVQDDVYLIFILNSAYCPKCFNDWISRSKRYKDDIELQHRLQERWYLNYGFKTV